MELCYKCGNYSIPKHFNMWLWSMRTFSQYNYHTWNWTLIQYYYLTVYIQISPTVLIIFFIVLCMCLCVCVCGWRSRIQPSITCELTRFFSLIYYYYFGHTTWHVGSQFLDQGLKPCPLHWGHGVLTTGPPGKRSS